MEEIRSFYVNLYSDRDQDLNDVDLDTLLSGYNIPRLANNEKLNIDKPITKAEILESLKSCKNNKTPGTSGFTVEFFKFFWKDLGDFLFRSYTCAFEKGELSISQKLGVISLLPKGDKPRQFLKNWRPISLLNVSYKILSGAIAGRIKSVLPNIIHENQKGFLSGRFIGENTRLMYDMIQICNEKNIPGLLLLIDFEKAFDSLSWKYLVKVMKFFNFGENIIRWIKIFCNDFKLCVSQNGFSSSFFKIGRGCRQGDPVSSYIFLLCVEVMAIMIRNNHNIQGIKVCDHEYKILQYADDTALLLDGSEHSLQNALTLIGQFAKFSGLKPNYSKTVCIKIGPLRYSNMKLCKNFNLTWSQEPFKFLGITFSVNLTDMEDLNYLPKLKEINNLIKSWSRRMLSTNGRITVVKTILLPRIVHLFISLPNPRENLIRELEKLLFSYIWNRKNDRIARKTIIQDYKHGGLRMVCVRSFIKSLKVTWIRRILHAAESISWYRLLFDMLPLHFKLFTNLGNELLKNNLNKISNRFWKDVFQSYYDLRKLVEKDNHLFEPLWYNNAFLINGKTLGFNEWIRRGIFFTYDLMNENGNLHSYNEFCYKFNFFPPFTIYYGIISCIRKKGWQFDMNLFQQNQPHFPAHIRILFKNHRGSRDFYDLFIRNFYFKPKSEKKWENEFQHEESSLWWESVNLNIKKLSNDCILKWFQYRITHRILGTNLLLHKIGLKDSNLCDFCQNFSESIPHLFIDCIFSMTLWSNVKIWLQSQFHINVNFGRKEILFNAQDQGNSLNVIVCLVKHYIYKQKLSKCLPSFQGAKQYIFNYVKCEQYIHKTNLQYEKFVTKWGWLNLNM